MFYFVPLEAALRLSQGKLYTAALDWFRVIYDYALPVSQRKIAFKIVLENDFDSINRSSKWLQNPLQPHTIAEVRSPSYTRYSILCLIRTLLDYADSEFTRYTSESLAQALDLYLKALELFDVPEFKSRINACNDTIGAFQVEIGEDEDEWLINEIRDRLNLINTKELRQTISEKIATILQENEPSNEKLFKANRIIDKIIRQKSSSSSEEKLGVLKDNQKKLENALSRNPHFIDSLRTFDAQYFFRKFYIPAPNLSFCVQPNPVVKTLKNRAENNLLKLRSCRNIAGLKFDIEPYVSPNVNNILNFDQLPIATEINFRPSPYRYATLIERAKQLVSLASQMEQSMLQFITAAEQEKYQLQKARQDLSLAEASVRLKELQSVLAVNGISYANVQRDRYQAMFSHYNNLILAGNSFYEEASLSFMAIAAEIEFFQLNIGAAASSIASIFSNLASFERRKEEWMYNRQITAYDIRSAEIQVDNSRT
jgi:hypothetical protein